MSSAYCYIIQFSIYSILLMNSFYLVEFIEKTVYTYQVSE